MSGVLVDTCIWSLSLRGELPKNIDIAEQLTQLVERLGNGGGGGVVVANDASPQRCHTLVARTSNLGLRAASLVVTCHMAQSMPRPADGEGYDRIVCDVPCTGDGTTRKHPEVFARWEVALALRQHPLQLQVTIDARSECWIGGQGWRSQ